MEHLQAGNESKLVHEWVSGMKLRNEVMWVAEDEKNFVGLNKGASFDGPVFFHYPGVEQHGHVAVRKNHNRVMSFPMMQTSSPFKYYSFKGAGYFDQHGIAEWGEIGGEARSYLGLMNVRTVAWDRNNSLRAKSFGVRIVEPVAVIKLLELPIRTFGGSTQIVPVEDLKAAGKLDKDFTPVVYLRKARCDTRVQDVITDPDSLTTQEAKDHAHEKFKSELPGVLKGLNAELGLNLNPRTYLEWFARACAQNVARLHKNGIAHNFIHPGNVTLAAEIIDLDGVVRHEVPDMSSPVQFDSMHDAIQAAESTQATLEQFKRDILAQEEDSMTFGIKPLMYHLAEAAVKQFPEAFRDGLEKWDNDISMYLFEDLFPNLDDDFWRTYVEEAPELKFLCPGFNFPVQGENNKRGK